MRMLGEQFVTGQTIDEALDRARPLEARGFRYSYDMLGEAATTAVDADRYAAAYEAAIHAIGRAAAGRGIYEGPGISIKLSALHPRYGRQQQDRVMAELLPRLRRWRGWPAATTSASTSMPKKPTGWNSRSTCWRHSASTRRWRAGTASASSCRPTRSARPSCSTGWSTWPGAPATG